MSAQYTPGPWTIGEYNRILTANGETLKVEGIALPNVSCDEFRANGRLIASAPELLAFARFILQGVRSGAIKAAPYTDMDPNAASLELKTVGGYAAEVIATATGEAS
ncbi:hypothetical protein [Variovorax paradoxus]|uniref:Uncharacterized protein n=1 Tax=Variovorax paradoxus TaxID=34073 RepID=A0A679JNF9_VARPD|nr:hypothetical protein VVAX_04372 [Variovorax paradoxus]